MCSGLTENLPESIQCRRCTIPRRHAAAKTSRSLAGLDSFLCPRKETTKEVGSPRKERGSSSDLLNGTFELVTVLLLL
jgi:hypothetical protein